MEKLYNNILLSKDFTLKPSDPDHVPYLENPPDFIDVTVGRQLFVDVFLIEETNLVPEYHKAEKYEGNPILYPVTEWEIAQSPVACPKSGGVWYDEDEGLFKMWYEAGFLRNMCYATSVDGLHWDRPNLHLEEGTNKILLYDGYEEDKLTDDLKYLRPDSTTVLIDYDCGKEERYKLFMRNPGGTYPGIIATSADGIHFENFRFTGEMDDRSTMFYNPFREKWVYSIREDKPVRCRKYMECDDFLSGANWSKDEAHLWMSVDETDTTNPYVGCQPELYNIDCIGYESIMLGMFQIMRGPQNPQCMEYGVPKITELIPMYSRDGYHFSRPSRECIINASLYKGAWDRGYVQSVGGGVIIHGDELWIYYVGFAGDEDYAGLPWTVNGMYRNGATGIAKLRRDGFVSMNGKGYLLTRKIIFRGKTSLHINAIGSVSVELLDADGNLLAKSNTFCGDSTKAELVFDKLVISEMDNKIFRMKFHVDGKLFSFGFADEHGDFGGSHAAGGV